MLEDELRRLLEPLISELVKTELDLRDRQWHWLTAEQVGELLGITAGAVRTRYWRGQLPGRKVEGRLYFDVVDVDRLIREA